jgi:hypothetical protein
MSHYTQVDTEFADKDYLIKALIESGFNPDCIEVHNIPQSLFGYQDDKRAEKANIIIRKAHVGRASNDLGFVKTPDGTYRAIVSEYDENSGGLNALAIESGGYNEVFMGRLLAKYAIIAAKTELEKQGCEVELITEDGKTRVVGKRQTLNGQLFKAGKVVKKKVASFFAR